MADQFTQDQLNQISKAITDGLADGFRRIDFNKLSRNDGKDSKDKFGFQDFRDNFTSQADGMLSNFGNALSSKQGDIQGFYGNILSASTKIADLIPGIGQLSEIFKSLGTSGLRYLVESNEAFKFLSKSGAGFNGDLMKIRKTSADLNMDLDDFTNFITRNSESLAVLGGTVDSGADKIAGYYQSLLDTGVIERFKRLGYTAEESAEFVAKNMSQQARAMYVQGLSETERNDQMSRYAKNLQILAKLTGQDVDALQEKLRNENLAGEEIAKNRMLEKRGIADAQTRYNTFKQMFEDMPDLQRLITQLYTRQAPLDETTSGLTSTLPTVTEAIKTALHNIETGTGDIFEDSALIQGKLQEALDRDSVLQTAMLGSASSATQALADLLVQGDKQSQKLAALRLQEEYKGLDNAQILNRLYSDANEATRNQLDTNEGLQNTMNELDKAQRATISTVQNSIIALFQNDQIKNIAEQIRITASTIPESLKHIEETYFKRLLQSLEKTTDILGKVTLSVFDELKFALLEAIQIKPGVEYLPKDLYGEIKKDIDTNQTTNLEKFTELGFLVREEGKNKKPSYTINPEFKTDNRLSENLIFVLDRIETKLSEQRATGVDPDTLLGSDERQEETREISIQGLEQLNKHLSSFPDIKNLFDELANKNDENLTDKSKQLSTLLNDTTKEIRTIVNQIGNNNFNYESGFKTLRQTLQTEVEKLYQENPQDETLKMLKEKLDSNNKISQKEVEQPNVELANITTVNYKDSVDKNTIAIESLTRELATTNLTVSIDNPKVSVDTTAFETMLNNYKQRYLDTELANTSKENPKSQYTSPTETVSQQTLAENIPKVNHKILQPDKTAEEIKLVVKELKQTNTLLNKQNRHLENLLV